MARITINDAEFGEFRDLLLQTYVDGFNDMLKHASILTGQNLVATKYDELTKACGVGLEKALKRGLRKRRSPRA